MKKGDFFWGAVLAAWIAVFVVPASRNALISFTSDYYYLSSFIKFFILATMGELLGMRILNQKWNKPAGFILRAVIWGFFGIAIALMFVVYNEGVMAAQTRGLLPGSGNAFITALLSSSAMNLTWGPMLFALHKFSDIILDLKLGEKLPKITLNTVLDRYDFRSLVKVSWIKGCICFWIPAHTLVFLLESDYRILVSAFLSIVLGVLTSLAKKAANKH